MLLIMLEGDNRPILIGGNLIVNPWRTQQPYIFISDERQSQLNSSATSSHQALSPSRNVVMRSWGYEVACRWVWRTYLWDVLGNDQEREREAARLWASFVCDDRLELTKHFPRRANEWQTTPQKYLSFFFDTDCHSRVQSTRPLWKRKTTTRIATAARQKCTRESRRWSPWKCKRKCRRCTSQRLQQNCSGSSPVSSHALSIASTFICIVPLLFISLFLSFTFLPSFDITLKVTLFPMLQSIRDANRIGVRCGPENILAQTWESGQKVLLAHRKWCSHSFNTVRAWEDRHSLTVHCKGILWSSSFHHHFSFFFSLFKFIFPLPFRSSFLLSHFLW